MTQIFSHLKKIFHELIQILKIIFRDWHIRKVINFSNFSKLLFIYIFSVVWVLSVEMDYSKNFWHKVISGGFSDKNFSFYSVNERIGEGMLYNKVLAVSDKQKYDYSSVKFSEALTNFFLTKHFYYVATSIANYLSKPKFNLALTHHVKILPYGYNISYLNMPRESLYDIKGGFFEKWSHLNDYDAYIDLYKYLHETNKYLNNIIIESKKDKPTIAFYLAQNAEDYKELSMNKALITGSLWGCNRSSLRLASALKDLANDGILVATGIKSSMEFLNEFYLGSAESFGNPMNSIKNLQQEYGIALIIHNQEHMLDGIPTSRISEAASSSNLIISDRNLFITKFFGDSVLYFDIFASSDEIYNQVKNHIIWAKENPKEARIKAKQSYQIFMDNFTLEKQLNELFLKMQNQLSK